MTFKKPIFAVLNRKYEFELEYKLEIQTYDKKSYLKSDLAIELYRQIFNILCDMIWLELYNYKAKQ